MNQVEIKGVLVCWVARGFPKTMEKSFEKGTDYTWWPERNDIRFDTSWWGPVRGPALLPGEVAHARICCIDCKMWGKIKLQYSNHKLWGN